YLKDIFVQVDYLVKYNANGTVQHSHLPQRKALDMVGNAFKSAPVTAPASCDPGSLANFSHTCQGVNVHFDIGPQVYQGDQFVIQNGIGGHAISESDSTVVCHDSGPTLCQFPDQVATAWKGDFLYLRDIATLPVPYFQSGRTQSYRWAL